MILKVFWSSLAQSSHYCDNFISQLKLYSIFFYLSVQYYKYTCITGVNQLTEFRRIVDCAPSFYFSLSNSFEFNSHIRTYNTQKNGYYLIIIKISAPAAFLCHRRFTNKIEGFRNKDNSIQLVEIIFQNFSIHFPFNLDFQKNNLKFFMIFFMFKLKSKKKLLEIH